MKKYIKHISFIIYFLLNSLNSVKSNDDEHITSNVGLYIPTETSDLKSTQEYFGEKTSETSYNLNNFKSELPNNNVNLTPDSYYSYANGVATLPLKTQGNGYTTQLIINNEDTTTTNEPVTIKSIKDHWKNAASRFLFIPKKNFKEKNIDSSTENDIMTLKNKFDNSIMDILTTLIPEKITSDPLTYKNLNIKNKKNREELVSDIKEDKLSEIKLDINKIGKKRIINDKEFHNNNNNNNNISVMDDSLFINSKIEPISEQITDVLQAPDGLDPLLSHEENDLFTRWSSEEQEIEMEQSVSEGALSSNSFDMLQKNYLLQLRGNTTIVGIRPKDFIKYLKLNLAARLSLEYDQVKVVGVHIVPASQVPWLIHNDFNENKTNIKFKTIDLHKDDFSKVESADWIEVNLTLIFNQQNTNSDLNALTRTTLLELSGHEYIIEGLLPTHMNSNSLETATNMRNNHSSEFTGALIAALFAAVVFIIVIRLHQVRSKNCLENASPDLTKASVIYKGFYGQEPYIYTEIDPPETPRQMKLNIFTCRPGSILVPSKRGLGGNLNVKISGDIYDTQMQSHLINCSEK